MTATLLQRAKAELGAMMVPITVDDFHLMMRTGILREGDPIELIDGLLVRKDQGDRGIEIRHEPHHASTVRRLNRLLSQVNVLGGCHQIQLPVTLASTQ